MSFILNALRKSESERQRLSGAAVAEFPLGRRAHRQPWWVYALAALLLLNLVVLALVLWRKPVDEQPVAVAPPMPSNAVAQIAPTIPVNAAPNPTLRETAAPPQVIYESVPAIEREIAAAANVPDGPTLVRPTDTAGVASSIAPTITPDSAPIQDAGELKLDLHVYSPNAGERFVMISMRRYSEGQRLPNGATVEQITPTGVVLYRNGQRYQLSR